MTDTLFLPPLTLPSFSFDNMVVEFDVQSTSNLETIYKISVYPKENYVECNCIGFATHGRCRHVKFYKKLIKSILHEKVGVTDEK